jgi:hypothetical protein
MATRLYLHDSRYAVDTFTGKYNQGARNTVMYGGFYDDTSGVHVVCGQGAGTTDTAALLKSTNGYDWRQGQLSGGGVIPPDSFSQVTYGNGVWVAIDVIGKIYSSTDAFNWTLRFTDTSARFFEKVVYKNGTFVAVGDTNTGVNGIIAVSTDGTTWSLATNANGTNIIGVDYSPTLNLWLAVGSTGGIWTATNPAGTWSYTTVGSVSRYCVIWDAVNSLWIAGGINALLETSTNGTTWTSRSPAGLSATADIWSIDEITGSGIVAGGTEGTILTSTNGTTWTIKSPGTNPLPDAVDSIYAVWYGESGSVYVTGGVSMIYKSTDFCNTWTTVGSELSTATPDADSTSALDQYASELRLMNTSLGAGQNTSVSTSASISGTAQQQLCGMFASLPLSTAQTVGGGTMILNTAQSGSSAAAAFSVNSLNIYVWRPSTGAIVGYVRDSGSASLGGGTGGTGETVQHITDITTSAVSAQKGDIIVCEIWANSTQTMASPYTCTFYFDGTTATTTQGTTVTNHASFIELAETLTFSATPVTLGFETVWVFTT